jgi:hypothetical protein
MTSENEPDFRAETDYVEGMRQLADYVMTLPHADVLSRFALLLYTPGLHNEMVEALRAAGVEGDLDEEVAKFGNQPAADAAHIIKRAKELREEKCGFELSAMAGMDLAAMPTECRTCGAKLMGVVWRPKECTWP